MRLVGRQGPIRIALCEQLDGRRGFYGGQNYEGWQVEVCVYENANSTVATKGGLAFVRALKTLSVLLVVASMVGAARAGMGEQRGSSHGVLRVGQAEAGIHMCLGAFCKSVPLGSPHRAVGGPLSYLDSGSPSLLSVSWFPYKA